MPNAPIYLPESSAPSNLHLRKDVRSRLIESDMFDICTRIKEISEDLFIVELEDQSAHSYVIMEKTVSGKEELVMKVKELDARILTKLQYLRKVPLEQRVKEIEAEHAREIKADHEANMERLYDRMGGQFHRELERCGFITHRGKSYAKKGVAQPGKHG